MKKVLIFLLSLFFIISAMAQDQDPWVGTWTSESYSDTDYENSPRDSEGSFTEIIYTDYKLVIRITKNGDQYNVRAKTIKVKDQNYSEYHRPMTVTRMEGNSMWLESYEKKRPFYVNGRIDEYSDLTQYYLLTLNNGTLHYSHYRTHSIDYDKSMRYKGEENYEIVTRKDDLDLFNDDW